MSKMKITVRFRRETGDYRVELAGFEVRFYDFFEEIQFAGLLYRSVFAFFYHL